ncbi:hypothetical protein MMC34_008764 [Xylographa carneopallida]|nr:hypothetical protein [Xylographa carneopallida]
MSRGGGRGGKRVRAQIRAKGEDEDGHPLTLAQPKPEDFRPPPLYPPLPSTPQPFAATAPDTTQYLDTARLLSDFSTYSGYRLTAAQAESVRLERYSDRYRRVVGQRSFLDECPQPSQFLFPAELQRWGGRGSAGAATGGLGGKWLFLSTEAMQSHLDRLTVARDDIATAEASGGAAMKEERKDGGAGADAGQGGAASDEAREREEEGRANKRRGGDESDEDEEENEKRDDDDEDDDMGGGDYTDKYQEDDDGEGDDVFGDDDGDVF